MLVAGVQHPVLVEVGEQRAADSATACSARPAAQWASNGEVGLAAQREAVAPGHERLAAPSARRSSHSALRSEARALASSTSGQKRAATAARVLAGMQREPGRAGPGAAAGRRDDGGAVGLGLQLPEEAHAQHGRH